MRKNIFIVSVLWILILAYGFGAVKINKKETSATVDKLTATDSVNPQPKPDSILERNPVRPEKSEALQTDSGSHIDCFIISSSATEAASEDFQISASAGLTVMGSCASTSFILDQGFWRDFESGEGGCCVGYTGNANCSEEEEPDISDITRLIDYLYISHAELCCLEEADVDVSGGEPDISDITRLIDYLYLSHSALAPCP